MINKKIKIHSYAKDLLLALLLAVLAVIWFSNVIFSDNIIVHRDLARYFYPLKQFAAQSIKNLHIPLWNPYISCGKPFLAALQAAVFYPVSVIYYVLPSFDLAFNWFIIVHFFFAGLFMYCLMRYWKVSRPSSLISGIIFMFSGYLSSVVSMNTTLGSAVWAPLILLFYDKALRTRSLKNIFLTSLFLGFQLLGGIPDPSYAVFWLLLFYALGFGWVEYKKNGLKTFIKPIFIFAVVYCLFALLFMFQILPFAELLKHSNLAQGRSFAAASKWSLTPIELLAFVIPYICGDINVPSGYLGPQEWMISFYIGIPALIFIIILFLAKPGKKAYFFGTAVIVSLLAALGKYTPVYKILYNCVPGISGIRYPVKFILITTFSMSVLSGMGMESLLRGRLERKNRSIIKSLFVFNFALAVLVLIFISYWQQIGDRLMEWFFKNKQITGDLFNKHVFAYLNDSKHILEFFIIFTAAAFLIIVYLKNRIRKNIFIILILVLTFADLAAVNMGINYVMDRKYFSLMPETIKRLKSDDSLFRIWQEKEMWEINRTIYGLTYDDGMNERKKTFACNSSMRYGIYDTRGYDSIEEKDWYDFIVFAQEEPFKVKNKLISFLNAKYIISTAPINEKGVELAYKSNMSCSTLESGVKAYSDFYITKNLGCMERAFLADDAVVVKNKSVILGIMRNENYDPGKVVILEENIIPDTRRSILGVRKEYVNIITYKPEEVVIDVETNKPKWLVLSDTYYPGWNVFVDEKEDKIYKADYFLRAVHLNEGRHTVRFVYRPLSFRIGVLVSFAALVGIILLAVLLHTFPAVRRLFQRVLF